MGIRSERGSVGGRTAMITKLECQKCRYQWVPRVAAPQQCPRCKTRYHAAEPVSEPVTGSDAHAAEPVSEPVSEPVTETEEKPQDATAKEK